MQRIKKFLMPCGLCAAVPALKIESSSKNPISEVSDKTQERVLVRPSELPIYMTDEICTKPKSCANKTDSSILEDGFRIVRKSLQGVVSEYSSVADNFSNKFNTGYEHSLLMLDYLREESNIMPRLGAVGIGGLTGLIFSLRGGKFKRLVYTSTGALSVAAVCYPKQAQESFSVVKHYINIGYNFIYGVKPGDANQLEIKWPETPKIQAPKSAAEFSELVANIPFLGQLIHSLIDVKEDKSLPPARKLKEN